MADKSKNRTKTGQGQQDIQVFKNREDGIGAQVYPAQRAMPQAPPQALPQPLQWADPAQTELAYRSSSRLQRALILPLTILAWMVIGIIVLWLLRHVYHALILVILAVVVSFAVAPLVGLFKRWLTRPLAILGAYLVAIALVVGIGTYLVITAAGQVVNLVANLPGYITNAQGFGGQLLTVLRPFGVTSASLQDLNKQILTELQVAGAALAASSLTLVSQVATILLDAVLVLMMSIYFTLDGQRAVTWMKEKTPDNFRRYVRYILAVINHVIGGYVRGTLTMALLIGVLVGLGLYILNVPYAVLLGVLAFFMEFIPVVGVFISGAISLLVTLPSGLTHTLIVLAYFVIVHVIEGDIIGPRIMGKAVGIHPATGIIALLVGTELFGVWGALFGAPLAGLLQATVTGIWYVRQHDPEGTADIPVKIAMEAAEDKSPPVPTEEELKKDQ